MKVILNAPPFTVNCLEAIPKLEELYPQITQISADYADSIHRVKTTPPGINDMSTYAI